MGRKTEHMIWWRLTKNEKWDLLRKVMMDVGAAGQQEHRFFVERKQILEIIRKVAIDILNTKLTNEESYLIFWNWFCDGMFEMLATNRFKGRGRAVHAFKFNEKAHWLLKNHIRY